MGHATVDHDGSYSSRISRTFLTNPCARSQHSFIRLVWNCVQLVYKLVLLLAESSDQDCHHKPGQIRTTVNLVNIFYFSLQIYFNLSNLALDLLLLLLHLLSKCCCNVVVIYCIVILCDDVFYLRI